MADLLLMVQPPEPLLATLGRDHSLHCGWDADLAALPLDRIAGLCTVGSRGADAALLGRLPALQFISCFGSGYEKVDLAAARARGIRVTSCIGANHDCVADMAFALLLASARRLVEADRFVRDGRWAARVPRPGLVRGVKGRKLGILGLGAIGLEVAQRAQGFAMPVAYHNRRRRGDVPWPYFDSPLALAAWADIVVVALRAGPDNRHIIDASFLAALGPDGILVNVSRGSAVDEAALVAALERGWLAGAGLDVFEGEPAVSARLRALPNIVLTPHLAAATTDAIDRQSAIVLRQIGDLAAGRPTVGEVA